IWVGDFNHHHPMWDQDKDHRLFTRKNLDEAEQLLEMVAEWGMVMALPKGVPMLRNSQGNWMRPDNVFMSEALEDRVISCK
ncbi:hypothetical protein FA15DRAFT_552156, partial [Coprinopsis marcescibilis]